MKEACSNVKTPFGQSIACVFDTQGAGINRQVLPYQCIMRDEMNFSQNIYINNDRYFCNFESFSLVQVFENHGKLKNITLMPSLKTFTYPCYLVCNFETPIKVLYKWSYSFKESFISKGKIQVFDTLMRKCIEYILAVRKR